MFFVLHSRLFLLFLAGTRFMPHLGQRPGLADFTSGCIGQMYMKFLVFTFEILVFQLSFLWADTHTFFPAKYKYDTRTPGTD